MWYLGSDSHAAEFKIFWGACPQTPLESKTSVLCYHTDTHNTSHPPHNNPGSAPVNFCTEGTYLIANSNVHCRGMDKSYTV